MKLLSKPEVSLQSTMQRKSEIDSGIYLATRVDKLRESLVELEQQQKVFIDNNRKIIEESLSEKRQELQEAESKLKLAEERRTELLKPLDKEWEKVSEASKEVELLQSKLIEQTTIYENKIKEAEENITKTNQENQRAKVANETAQEHLRESRSNREQSDKVLSEVEELQKKTELDSENRMKHIGMKERKLDYERKHYEDFLANLRIREKELDLREKRLSIKENKLK
jgi:hypothetical protein